MIDLLKLRILVPLLIGLLSLIATSSSYLASYWAVSSTTKQTVINNLKDDLTRIQGILELIINHNQHSAVRKVVASFGAQPDMILTIVTNNQGKIIASTSHQYLHSQWQDSRLDINSEQLTQVISKHSIKVFSSTDERYVDGYISICPKTNSGRSRPGYCSFLLQRINLNHHINAATSVLKRQAFYTSIFVVILAAIFGFIIHKLFAKRSQLLANTVDAFTQGQRKVRSGIKGKDELSLIAKAVDQMLDTIERNEATITSEKNRLNALFNTVVDPIITTNEESLITSCNNAAKQVFNYNEKQLLNRSLYALVPDLFEHQNNSGRSGDSHIYAGLRAIRSDGSHFPSDISIGDIDINGHHENITVIRDITRRKSIESELKQHRDNLKQLVAMATIEIKAIVQTAVNGVITIDKNGIIQIFNPAAEKMFGWQAKEICGQNVNILLPKEKTDSHDGFIQRYLTTRLSSVIGTVREVAAKRKDDTTFPAMLSVGHSELSPGKHLFVAFITDISQQKEVEQQLRTAKEKAEMAARTKANFMANMSHEIRTPMNAIIGFSEILLHDKHIPETSRQFIRTIADSGTNLLQIINDILDYTKIEAGKTTLESLSFNLPKTIKNAMGMFQLAADKKNIDLTLTTPQSIPTMVYGDPTRLRQVLTNLIGNAIKFTNKGSITVKLHKDQHSDLICFTVKDTGIGMSNLQKHNVFDAFAQADSSTNRRFGGTGLGTTISKEIVELMGGQIWVESIQGQGSTFYFTAKLPESDIDIPEPPQIAQNIATHCRQLKILLAEDIDINAELITIRLSEIGHQITRVNDGQQVIEKFKQQSFDLILMDIQMPNIDGQTATRLIRHYEQQFQVTKPIPVIALTANVLEQDQIECFESGIDLVITKPINFNELFVCIDELIGANNVSTDKPEQHNQAVVTSEGPMLTTINKDKVLLLLIQLRNSLSALNPESCEPFIQQLAIHLDEQHLQGINNAISEFDFDHANELITTLANSLRLNLNKAEQ